jgi:amino-acid N-acetyltransferase
MTTTVDVKPTLRPARADDLAAVERLLAESNLPASDLPALFASHAGDFVVAQADGDGSLVGVAGLEVCADDVALLRSVAVRPAWRGRGLAETMVRRLVRDAESRGVRALYLLTMSAEGYFPRLGFTRVERDAVPAPIAATEQFRSMCPSSAVAMVRALA